MKTFSISNENRRNLIIAVVFQILNQVYIGFEFLYIDSAAAPDSVQQLLINIAYLVAYVFMAKTIYAYLKEMDLLKIAKTFFLIAILDVIMVVLSSVFLFAPELNASTGIVNILSFILWVRFGVLLYQEKGEGLEASYLRLRQYGVANLIIFIPAAIQTFIFAFYFMHLGLQTTIYLYMLIPQVFLLLFAFEIGKHKKKP